VISRDIHVVFDLDDDVDVGIPAIPNQLLYIYFPFEDRDLPDLTKLHEIGRLGATLISQGYRVLSHCGMGHNRSALLAGTILSYLGVGGQDALTLIRKKRMGALYNKNFAGYLQTLPPQPLPQLKKFAATAP
jgi:protein-tyrosine phosphatase